MSIIRHLYILLLFLISAGLYSQNFEGGFSVGMTASEVSGDQAAGPNKLGISIGVFTALPLSQTSEIGMELMYIQKGSKVNPSETKDYYRFHLEYIELPILYKYKFPSSFSSLEFMQKLVLEVGLSYSRLLRFKEATLERGNDISDTKKDVPYKMNEGNIILGFNYPLSESFNFLFRFSNSLIPISPIRDHHKEAKRIWYNWGQYHTVWNLSVNYTF